MAALARKPQTGPLGLDESRRYRILEVVGEGGFGKVYRARLEGASGFAKDVAIKLLTDPNAPEIVLQRFRDESRILGLVRDRAIITVDPPTRLEGRWAVVMEFVDGTNCQRLIKVCTLPPRTAVEVVQEVARALDHVYNQEGPDGAPLHLVHRDIKPGNIQITPAGTVKVLDFGIARAEFAARESKTTTHIGGTFGYIAPERLHGEEGPASDVYSLGVVLKALIAGRRPTIKNREKIQRWIEQDEDLQQVWALAEEMSSLEPDDRPSARDVEDRCAALGPTLRGETLRRWAEKHVVSFKDLEPDVLIGNVLTETMAGVPMLSSSNEISIFTAKPRRARFGLAFLLFSLGLVGIVGMGIAGVIGYLMARAPSVEEPVSVQARPAPPPPAPSAPVPVSIDPEGLDLHPAAAALVEAPTKQPAPVEALPKPAAVSRPNPVKPKPEAVLYPLSFGSIPVGATIRVDGRSLGAKPVFNHRLAGGTHVLKMSFPDGRQATKKIRVGPDEPKRYIWKGGNTWSVFY